MHVPILSSIIDQVVADHLVRIMCASDASLRL